MNTQGYGCGKLQRRTAFPSPIDRRQYQVLQLLQHFRTLADGLAEIRLFARLGAKAADILVRPGRHQGAGRSKGPANGDEARE